MSENFEKVKKFIESLENKTFNDLNEREQEVLAKLMRPESNSPFNSLQRQLLENWYLEVPQEQIGVMNELSLNKISKPSLIKTKDDKQYLHVSLLTNCRLGEPFDYLRDFMFDLKLVFVNYTNIYILEVYEDI